MAKAIEIIRLSIHAYLQSYHHFTSIAALLVFPVSVAALLSQSLSSSSSSQTISTRLDSLFHAAGFPAFSAILTLKFSQTIFSFIFTLPFTVTFLLLAKASTILTVTRRSYSPSPFRLYRPLLLTHLFNTFLILAANATVFSLLFLAFNTADVLGLSSNNLTVVGLSTIGAILYSVVLANTIVACNLAVVVAATDRIWGYLPVLKACVLMRGKVRTALAIALPTNMAMAAVEALFCFRVARPYHLSGGRLSPAIVSEGFMISHMYAILMVLDVIVSCMFFKHCCESGLARSNLGEEDYYRIEMEPEEKTKGDLALLQV